ncbi:MAG: RsmG family class I SAM-dependent methyltransferase [Ilumatobacteraceae bacterium]
MQSAAVPPVDHEGLLRVLGEAQRIGTLGQAPLAEIIRHATWYADALPAETNRVIDLGSGAGVPGLIIALVRPNAQITLVDRRAKCTDALLRAVAVLNLGDRVGVRRDDVEHLSRQPEWRESFDAAVSRGFGPPHQTLMQARLFVRVGGVVVISEPPADVPHRWIGIDLGQLGLSGPHRLGPVGMFHVEHNLPIDS